jgi:hypothetical protein
MFARGISTPLKTLALLAGALPDTDIFFYLSEDLGLSLVQALFGSIGKLTICRSVQKWTAWTSGGQGRAIGPQ